MDWNARMIPIQLKKLFGLTDEETSRYMKM